MSFKASLSVGQLGEALFFEAHEGRLIRSDGRKGDFVCALTGNKLELKTDSYPMAKTENFFIERYSNMETQTPGGPWQAQANSCPQFAYMYVSDLTCFQFDTNRLIEEIERLAPDLDTREIPNKGWKSFGYLVPRELLKAIYYQFKITAKVVPVVHT